MRNARIKKRLDLRKSFRAARSPNLRDIVLKQYPDLNNLPFYEMYNIVDQIIFEWIGLLPSEGSSGEIAKSFRQCLNQKQRAKEKHAINIATRNKDWDDFVLPKNRRNLRYLYW